MKRASNQVGEQYVSWIVDGKAVCDKRRLQTAVASRFKGSCSSYSEGKSPMVPNPDPKQY